jgi:citrate lyase subunit beta/citryl-CoA lyase
MRSPQDESEARRDRLRRSALAVPASSSRKLEKAALSDADEVFIDLEDACAPSQKEAGRATAVDALVQLDWNGKLRAVRINEVGSPWCHDDVIALVAGAGNQLDCIMVPKVEAAAHVQFVDLLLTQLERKHILQHRIGIEVLIESAAGVVAIHEIARASTRLETLIFGAGDYAASIGLAQFDIGMVDASYPGHQWHWVMSEIASHAHAAGLLAIDGPYVDFHDEAGYSESARRSRSLGFAGKWCIHPNQIPWANLTYAPTQSEYEEAERLLELYTAATNEGLGAIAVDGKLVDEATRKMAQRTAVRGRALGLTRPPSLSTPTSSEFLQRPQSDD